MKNCHVLRIAAIAIGTCLAVSTAWAQAPDRTVLPSPPPSFSGKIGLTYKDSTPDWRPTQPLAAPDGAPNVLVVVLDDVGYAHLGSYGGAIDTPNLDRLAARGVRYTNFHTTALCSPSRAALLTGRNHHALGMAAITEAATGFPGSNAMMPKSAATVAEIFKQNGYNTMALGKWHLTPYTAYTAAGPFDRWPLGQGFEKFYGFLGGETDQWAPLLVRDNHLLDPITRPGYHLTEGLVDQAISDIRDQQQAQSGRPFFMYLSLAAAHAPLHAPKAFIDKYKGRFDQGWDKAREETHERQKKLGIVAPDQQLSPRDPMVSAWADLKPNEQKLYVRLQETFAGMVDHADQNLGRLFAALDQLGIAENTLIMVVSDNGASQEGLRNGATNTDRFRNFNPETVDEMLAQIDKIGGPESDPHYPMGWALVGNTPFKRWKQDTHGGGNTDPLIVSWPARIKSVGALRTQYHHIVDIAPTLLEAAWLPAPSSVNGVAQMPVHGISMAYTFTDAKAPTRRKVQYFEMLGSRGLWADGWKAVTWHRPGTSWDDDRWELYHTDVDLAEINDLATAQPGKLDELKALWLAEARKYQVLPLDDRRYERANIPDRPVAAMVRPLYTYYPGTSIMHPLAAPQLLGREHIVTAMVDVAAGAEGVLACSGTEQGGWSLFVKNGKLHYTHNYLRIAQYHVESASVIAPGAYRLGVRVVPTGSSRRPAFSTANVTLLIDGAPVGELKDIKVAAQYSALTGYGLQIGRNAGTPIGHEYEAPFAFSSGLDRVTIEVE